jgi:hypothetical protein
MNQSASTGCASCSAMKTASASATTSRAPGAIIARVAPSVLGPGAARAEDERDAAEICADAGEQAHARLVYAAHPRAADPVDGAVRCG